MEEMRGGLVLVLCVFAFPQEGQAQGPLIYIFPTHCPYESVKALYLLEQLLTLLNQAVGLTSVDGLIVEGRAFQQL